MSGSPSSSPRPEDGTPFLIRVFCRNGSFHRPEEFGGCSLPTSVSLYAWPSTTLNTLAYLLAAEESSLLPNPCIGTRLSFRLVFPDTRNLNSRSEDRHAPPARFMAKDLGSLVLGQDDPGFSNAAETDATNEGLNLAGGRFSPDGENSGETTLKDARFVIGDYVSCAILPPLADGSVAPAAHAVSERERPVPPGAGFGGSRRDGRGFGRHDAGSGRGDRGRRRPFGGDLHPGFPSGDWRRGDDPYDPSDSRSPRRRGGYRQK